MAIDVVALARDWIGTPYQHQASVKGAGCDCLGLIRGVWRERHGDEPEVVPPYTSDWAEASGAETLRDACARHLTPIQAVAPGCVVLFRMTRGGPAKHCGIIAETDGRLTLIHARQNRQVMEEDFGAFWRARLAYIFSL